MNKNKITDAAEQGFIRMASVSILQSLIEQNQTDRNADSDNILIAKSVNLAYQLNDEINKRFSNSN